MKIGLTVPGGFDSGGHEATIPALQALAQQLSRRHEVHVFASAGRYSSRHRLGSVEVTQLGPRDRQGRRPFRTGHLVAAFASWVARAGRFDVLHAFWADRTALLVTGLARALSVPSVVSLGGGELVWLPDIPYGGAGTVRSRAITGAALRLAGAVTAGTAFVAKRLPPPIARAAEILPLGVDTSLFWASPNRPPGPPWRLIHVANLNIVKDQPTLLAAMRRVVDRLGDVRLDCVGTDTLDGAVQARARALGLEDRVTFHGFLPQARLAELYRRAHLHVLSSRYESQAVVVLEAAAAGLGTVGTRVGLVDALAPHAARAVPVGDAAALGDAIAGVLVDGPGREAMGAAAQAFARAHDVAWTAATFESIYQRLRPPIG